MAHAILARGPAIVGQKVRQPSGVRELCHHGPYEQLYKIIIYKIRVSFFERHRILPRRDMLALLPTNEADFESFCGRFRIALEAIRIQLSSILKTCWLFLDGGLAKCRWTLLGSPEA